MEIEIETAGLKARLKQIEGGKLTARESKALERWQRETKSELRDSLFRSVPKGIYCELAGRQNKVVDEFGQRYDVPVDLPEINLFEAVAALHTRVSELAAAARPNLEGDEAELVREKLRQEIGKLQRQSASIQIELDKHMEKLLNRADVKTGLDWLSNKLRAVGTRLYREAGQPAVDALNELLEELAKEIDDGALRF